jgi:hypothetical protein
MILDRPLACLPKDEQAEVDRRDLDGQCETLSDEQIAAEISAIQDDDELFPF